MEILKNFLYFGKWNLLVSRYVVHFKAQVKKKESPWKDFLYSWKIKLSNSNVKTVLIFSQKKAVLIFQETEIQKKFMIFSSKKLFLYFRKRKPPKNHLYLRKRNFLWFQEMKILKNFLYFWKQNFPCSKN